MQKPMQSQVITNPDEKGGGILLLPIGEEILTNDGSWKRESYFAVNMWPLYDDIALLKYQLFKGICSAQTV